MKSILKTSQPKRKIMRAQLNPNKSRLFSKAKPLAAKAALGLCAALASPYGHAYQRIGFNADERQTADKYCVDGFVQRINKQYQLLEDRTAELESAGQHIQRSNIQNAIHSKQKQITQKLARCGEAIKYRYLGEKQNISIGSVNYQMNQKNNHLRDVIDIFKKLPHNEVAKKAENLIEAHKKLQDAHDRCFGNNGNAWNDLSFDSGNNDAVVQALNSALQKAHQCAAENGTEIEAKTAYEEYKTALNEHNDKWELVREAGAESGTCGHEGPEGACVREIKQLLSLNPHLIPGSPGFSSASAKAAAQSLPAACSQAHREASACCLNPAGCALEQLADVQAIYAKSSTSACSEGGAQALQNSKNTMCQRAVTICRRACDLKRKELARKIKQCFAILGGDGAPEDEKTIAQTLNAGSHTPCYNKLADISAWYTQTMSELIANSQNGLRDDSYSSDDWIKCGQIEAKTAVLQVSARCAAQKAAAERIAAERAAEEAKKAAEQAAKEATHNSDLSPAHSAKPAEFQDTRSPDAIKQSVLEDRHILASKAEAYYPPAAQASATASAASAATENASSEDTSGNGGGANVAAGSTTTDTYLGDPDDVSLEKKGAWAKAWDETKRDLGNLWGAWVKIFTAPFRWLSSLPAPDPSEKDDRSGR